eukprot:4044951-Pyramimonas_sp.AAC.2
MCSELGGVLEQVTSPRIHRHEAALEKEEALRPAKEAAHEAYRTVLLRHDPHHYDVRNCPHCGDEMDSIMCATCGEFVCCMDDCLRKSGGSCSEGEAIEFDCGETYLCGACVSNRGNKKYLCDVQAKREASDRRRHNAMRLASEAYLRRLAPPQSPT